MMTKEEQQAFFEKQRQERLNNCRIKTQEQFIEECQKADIQNSWYAFAEAGNRVVMLNPATDNYFHSRSWYIRDENFDLAYAKAGIK